MAFCHAGLRVSHLWLQGSSGAPGPSGSPGTPVSTGSQSLGSGTGFLARGRGCLAGAVVGSEPRHREGVGRAGGLGWGWDCPTPWLVSGVGDAGWHHLKQPPPLPSSHRDPLASWGQKETRWVQRQGGLVGARACSAYSHVSTVVPVPWARGILGATSRTPPARGCISLSPLGRVSRARCVPPWLRGRSVSRGHPANRDPGERPEHPARMGSR